MMSYARLQFRYSITSVWTTVWTTVELGLEIRGQMRGDIEGVTDYNMVTVAQRTHKSEQLMMKWERLCLHC